MKHEFSKRGPMLRLACAVAAMSVTLSVGGLVDFIAAGYAVAHTQHGPVLTAERKAVVDKVSQPGINKEVL